ncbi:hypothetical protein GQ43DRAFT_441369 [Delitschia confertaspora ATCC 74209]|uniref:Zn(2)-C6 fungal-type domain-containing protein n=1 Tax=Delitschia confertaspora ATCC 74209 TaxID=1513339 RepID=A0A9P4MY86_9PLEO|nr:hypothetical protein GQ43DRAFT_441369 [Delitschia confertaspora ATCC 74209]
MAATFATSSTSTWHTTPTSSLLQNAKLHHSTSIPSPSTSMPQSSTSILTSATTSGTTSSLPTPSTTTLPRNPLQDRKPKLRASCDACAASKVKCSKDHPICNRCRTNGGTCIYGLSRKHGKAGRVRKKIPDNAASVGEINNKSKPSKQRPSPNGKEFSKFRVRAEPVAQDAVVAEVKESVEKTQSGWGAMDTTGLQIGMVPEVPDLDLDSPMQDHNPQSVLPDFSFMDDLIFSPTNTENMQTYQSPATDSILSQTVKPELTFRDPFSKQGSSFPRPHTPLPSDFQALKDFIGGGNDGIESFDYTLQDESNIFGSEVSGSISMRHDEDEDQSPMSTSTMSSMNQNTHLESSSMSPGPHSHCCYTQAYAILESLHFRRHATDVETFDGITDPPLDTLLATTKRSIRTLHQLLTCPCAHDPHLAMLYASITSKILSWYQRAAGIPTSSSPPATSAAIPPTPPLSSTGSSTVSSPSMSGLSCSIACTPRSAATPSFPIKLQPIRIGGFEFDDEDQYALRQAIILRELRKCSGLVDAIANWRTSGSSSVGSPGSAGQGGESAEFLFDVLGAWLKSELFRTMRELEVRERGE